MTFEKRTALFGAYTLGVLVAHWNVLHAVASLATHNPTASHLLLVPVLSAALVYSRRRALIPLARTDWSAAVACVGLAAGLMLLVDDTRLARTNDSLSVRVAAMLALWAAGFVFLYGRTAVRVVRFPLLFSAFMIPIPSTLLGNVTHVLKVGSAETVSGMFSLLGVPFFREEFVFKLSECVIEIADECSGIRSSIALLLTSLLAGHIFLATGWKKALLVAAVLPVAVLKNAIRIVTLTLLAQYVNPVFLSGRLHNDGGIVFYLLALALLSPLLIALRRSDFGFASSRAA